jgi:hypothetical protein
MSAIQVLHTDRVPATGFLCVPGRLDFQQILHLEKKFLGRKITYLIEENDQHEPALRGHMEKSGNGAMFSCTDKNAAAAGKEFAEFLKGNGIILFVPGRAATRPATPIHAPSGHLKILSAFGLPLLPIAIDCPRESCLGIERISSLPSAVIAFGITIPAKDSCFPTLQAHL